METRYIYTPDGGYTLQSSTTMPSDPSTLVVTLEFPVGTSEEQWQNAIAGFLPSKA